MALIITLILIGLLLLAIELLIIPGFGLIGVLGLLSVIGAIVLSFTEFGHVTGLIVLGSVIVVISLSMWMILRSKTWKRISLKESIVSRVDSAPIDKGLEPGIKGITLSRLAPSGKARFGLIDTEVWSQMGIIDSSSEIEIVNIDENKIIVKQTE